MAVLKRSVGSLVDQVILSALNFGIAFALIQGISKTEYGMYVQLILFGLLATSLVDALIGNSFNILNSRPDTASRDQLLAKAMRLSGFSALVFSAVGGCYAFWLEHDGSLSADQLLLVAAFIGYTVVLVQREFKRVCLYLTDRWQQALALDALYAALVVCLTGAAWWAGQLTLTRVFVVLGVSSALAAAMTPSLVHKRTVVLLPDAMGLLKQCWAISAWALPGVVVGWAINNAYLFVLNLVLGAAATAELNASKLAVMPLMLSLIAWYQVSRSDIARLAQADVKTGFKPFLIKSAILMYVPVLLYVPLFYLVFPWLEPVLAAKGYTHMGTLVTFWFVLFLLNPIKYLGTSMLVGFEAFKSLLKLNLVSLTVQTVGVYYLATHHELPTVLFALMAADLIEGAVMWGYLLPRHLSRS